MNTKKHSKEQNLLPSGGFGNQAIAYIQNSLASQKKGLDNSFKDNFFLTKEKLNYDEDEYQKHISELKNEKQFMANHGQQVHWNKGTLDISKYKDKLADIQDTQSQLDLTMHMISKKADQMTYKLDPAAQKHNEKISEMKKMHENQDKLMFEEVKADKNIEKWKGTGLEDEIIKYENPVDRRKKPLFEKGYMSLDGPVTDYATRGAIDASYKSLSHKMKVSEQQKKLREYTKDKIHSQSKFFILKGAEKLPSHYKERLVEVTTESKVKVYGQQYELQEINPSKKKGKISEFGKKQEEAKIPMVKNWFESLQLEERALCVSTVDRRLAQNMRDMHNKLKKVMNNECGKFKMIFQQPANGNTPKPEISYIFNICNSRAFVSSPERQSAELELLSYIRLTDTFELHDTITVCQELLANPEKFYQLAESIAGQLFLKTPHDIKYMESDWYKHCFESKQPPWLDMSEPNSLATWVLYYIERAIFIQYSANVYGEYVSCKDANKQPVFVNTDGKYVVLKDEMKPFWRTFCEQKEDVQDLLTAVKENAYSSFGMKQESVSSFNGGLKLQDPGQRALVDRIESFVSNLRSAIDSYPIDSQLDLKTLCLNTLSESSISCIGKTPLQTAETFLFEIDSQKAPLTKSVTQSPSSLITKIDVILERIFVEQFLIQVNSKLKSRFTSQNKKLQKKKLKKLKQKEQQQEKEREQQQQQPTIKVNNSNAIEMLLGIQDDTPAEKTNDFSDVVKKKKKKKKLSTPEEKDILTSKEETVPENINPQNYFQVFAHKFAAETSSNTIKTQSTCEETKKVKIPTELAQAMSNEEILKLTDYKTGNAQVSNKQWQRASRTIVSDLISESSQASQPSASPTVIDVRVKNNKLYSDIVQDCTSSSSSTGPHKSIITFKKKPNPKIVRKPSSSSSSALSSDEAMLPDLFNIPLQPEENDSSDYGGEEEGSSEESESVSVSKSRKKKSNKSAQIVVNNNKKKKAKKGKKAFIIQEKWGQKGEIRGIDFYGEEKVEDKIVFQEEKIINRWTKLKDIPTFTCQYIEKEAQHQFEHIIPETKKNNKKNKKQKKQEWESKYADKEPEIQQIEIIKPVLEVKKETPIVQITKKQKKKIDAQASAEAMNSFIKKIAGQTQEKPVPPPEPEPVMEAPKPKKPEPVVKEIPKKAQAEKKQKLPYQGNQPKERLSMMEEAKILSTGYRYEKKQKETTESPVKKEQSPKPEPIYQVKSKSSIEPPKSSFGGLSLESKEFTAIENEDIKNPEKQPEKKKQKKVRSNKNKKKKQMQQSWIDPITGMEMYQYGEEAYQVPATVNKLIEDNGLKQGLHQMQYNPQLQDLLSKLNEQLLVQQQKQLQEYQLRQQQEAEMMILEECQPCQEINSKRYDLFFDQLELEMKNKVKEIDLLKDSVRKERQGFISIVETIVKNTFTNRYGNGFVGIKIFGSMATELAIESSDVDLVVTGINSIQGRDPQYGGKNQLLKMMQKLFDNLQFLKDKGQIYKIKFIHGANVPIIKLVVDLQAINQTQIQKAIAEVKREREEQKASEFQFSSQRYEDEEIDLQLLGLGAKTIDEKMRYLKVDISIDEQSHQYQNLAAPKGHSGIDTIYHIQELVLQRKDLRPIVMIIKKIFDETFLSMPYFGGISSYSLVLMVSAYLKRFDSDKQESLSRNLSGFFHFYGVGFKPHLFYLNGDKIEFCEDSTQRPFVDPFIVLDPLDPTNNISHSTFRIKDIQRALVQAFKIINESCEKFQEDQKAVECTPKQVLERLMTSIRQQYQVMQNIYDDEF